MDIDSKSSKCKKLNDTFKIFDNKNHVIDLRNFLFNQHDNIKFTVDYEFEISIKIMGVVFQVKN